MKKLIITLSLAFIASLPSFCVASEGSYKLDEQQLDEMFSQSQEITYEQMMATELAALNLSMENNIVAGGGAQTRGGYLVRAFFCGGIALHRSYMGTGGKSMWWFYLCVPIVGGFDACVDFWWVVFKSEALDKYKDNSKFFVWAGD